jgi:hypothetical protein
LLVFSIKYVCVKVCLWVWSIVNTDNIIYFVCQLRVLVLQGFWAFVVLVCGFSFRFVKSCRSGLYLIYYISSGRGLCRRFNMSIHGGHVESNVFVDDCTIQNYNLKVVTWHSTIFDYRRSWHEWSLLF